VGQHVHTFIVLIVFVIRHEDFCKPHSYEYIDMNNKETKVKKKRTYVFYHCVTTHYL
jgi:hypothetical protein